MLQVEVDVDAELTDMGMDSMSAITLRDKLEERFPKEKKSMTSNFLFDHPSVNAIVPALSSVSQVERFNICFVS